MASRRVFYGLALLAALAFQLTNDNYLAHLLLGLCVTLPILSLLLSLPAALTCRLTLAAERDALDRGEQGKWLISAEWRGPLPLPRLSARLTERNCLTGGRSRRRFVMPAPTGGRPITRPADTAHCALLELRADRVRVCDYLGLFTIPRPAPQPAQLLVLPVPVDPGPLDLPQGQGSRPGDQAARPKGPGEDYELRDYRPGDPMRRVHWKLSAKRDELIVREPWETDAPLPLLTFDRLGGPDAVDRVLDRVLGLSRALLAVQQPHALLWLDSSGEPRYCPVSDERELRLAMLDVLSAPVPVSGPSVLDRPELIASPDGPAARILVTAGEEARHD